MALRFLYFDVNASDSFAPAEIERARRYHRPLYAALFLDWALQAAVLALIAFGPPNGWTAGPWWARVLELVALTLGVSAVVRLPLSAWRGWARERRWGFSTQSFGSWLEDLAKGLFLGLALSGLALLALVWSARTWPSWWPAVAAPAAALLALVLSLLAPLLFERLFNRFSPLEDEALARDLRELSVQAEVPVRTILVSDASRRTTKHNAYVSGLGPTRRLVVFDTLLGDASVGELRAVVAHELGHRRFRHVAVGTALAMVGAAVGVLVVWLVLRWSPGPAMGAGDPRAVPLIMLVLWLLEVVALPWETWLSRRWERTADRFALELTGDGATLETMHRRLALANLADLDPPRALYVLLFTHPTPPERIAAAQAANPGVRHVPRV